MAAFLVTARAAVSIETDILNGWRQRGLPSETVVTADGIDLAADVARLRAGAGPWVLATPLFVEYARRG